MAQLLTHQRGGGFVYPESWHIEIAMWQCLLDIVYSYIYVHVKVRIQIPNIFEIRYLLIQSRERARRDLKSSSAVEKVLNIQRMDMDKEGERSPVAGK